MLNILCQVGKEALECNILQAMKRELETHGWCKHEMRADDNRICLVGSLYQTLDLFAEELPNGEIFRKYERLTGHSNEQMLREILIPYMNGNLIVSTWNDNVAETPQDVVDLLEKAIADRGGFV